MENLRPSAAKEPVRPLSGWVLRWLPWLILLVGVVVFTVSYRADSSGEQQKVDAASVELLDRVENSVREDLAKEADLLLSVSASFEGAQNVNEDDFERFLTTAGSLDEEPQRHGVAWAIGAAEGQGVIVTFVEPSEGEALRAGLDVTADETIREALDRATARGEVVASRPSVASGEGSPVRTTLVAPPIQRAGIGFGVVLLEIHVDEMLRQRVRESTDFRIVDVGPTGGEAEPDTLLYEAVPGVEPSDSVRRVDVAGRTWSIEIANGALARASWYSIVLRSLPTLVAAIALAGIVQSLAKSRERSERRAQELTAEIVQKNDELQRSNEWLESFTRVASHDLRSPLRAVHSLVGFIREDHPDLEESAMYNLARIEQRVDRMNVLIDDLLTLARVSDATEKVSEVHFESMLNDIIETVDVPEGFTIEIDVVGEPTGELAATQFKTCIQNLVDNALKHHDRDDGHVAIGVQAGSHEVSVAVRDDGPGIPEQYLSAIFEPFRRLRPDDTAPGSGIGLTAIVRTAAMNHGSIDVESTEGEGTLFTLTWPLGDL